MKQQQIERNRLWMTVFFAGIIAVMAAAAAWWMAGSARIREETPVTKQSSLTPPPPTVSVATSPSPATPGVDPIGLKLLREDLVREGAGKRIGEMAIHRALQAFTPDADIAALIANQPEFVKTASDYVGQIVSETRIANGRAKLAEYGEVLRAIETRFGVDRHVLVAIWGIESAYGTSMGEKSVVRSLATLALIDPRRPAFWRNEFLGALAIIERGDTTAERMAGSWAGAMGHTQFMPTTFNTHAVDFDGDGRRDIWNTPADALASSANYLKNSGWIAGEPAALEVALPAGFDLGLSSPSVSKSAAEWASTGVTPTQPGALPARLRNLSLILPAGANGPAFLTGANFRAILRYNNATAYALAVSLLADRLSGAPPLVKPWPADDRPLSRTDREELQARLQDLGYDVGIGIDGVIGTGTRNAIRAFQRAHTLPEDGHPNLILLQALRQVTGNQLARP